MSPLKFPHPQQFLLKFHYDPVKIRQTTSSTVAHVIWELLKWFSLQQNNLWLIVGLCSYRCLCISWSNEIQMWSFILCQGVSCMSWLIQLQIIMCYWPFRHVNRWEIIWSSRPRWLLAMLMCPERDLSLVWIRVPSGPGDSSRHQRLSAALYTASVQHQRIWEWAQWHVCDNGEGYWSGWRRERCGAL